MSLCPRAAAQALGSPQELQQHEYKSHAAYFDDHTYSQYKLQTSNQFAPDQEPLLESQPSSARAASSTSSCLSRPLAFLVTAATSTSRQLATDPSSRRACLAGILVANLVVTVACFIAACIHYNTFTTLFLYLALLVVTFPFLSLSLFVVNQGSNKYHLQLSDSLTQSTSTSEQSSSSSFLCLLSHSSSPRPSSASSAAPVRRRRSCRLRHLQSLARAAQYFGAVLWFLAVVEWIFFQPILAPGTATARDEIASYLHASPAAHTTPARPIKVFIVSNLYNSEEILPAYSSSLQRLIEMLGVDNVFVSIYESHSTDQTKPMLRQLDRELAQSNVSHRILIDDRAERKGKMSAVSDRLSFLADLRNTAMQPLVQAADMFSHVLWINDIIFSPQDALELLYTNRATYDQACAMDFIGNGFYDTWVTRDVEGGTLKRQWPYFKRAEDVEQMRRGKPFEVNSCWNGMTAFDAEWFYPSTNGTSHFIGVDDQDGPLSLPLKFRTSTTCLSSECQLISYDIHRATHATARRPTILINPAVKLAYNHRHYYLYNSLIPSPIVRLWRMVWRDWIAYRWFGWVSEHQRWPNECQAKQKYWAAPASQATTAAV